jgi:hypothetical protein
MMTSYPDRPGEFLQYSIRFICLLANPLVRKGKCDPVFVIIAFVFLYFDKGGDGRTVFIPWTEESIIKS